MDKNELEKRVEQLTKAKAHYKAGIALLHSLRGGETKNRLINNESLLSRKARKIRGNSLFMVSILVYIEKSSVYMRSTPYVISRSSIHLESYR